MSIARSSPISRWPSPTPSPRSWPWPRRPTTPRRPRPPRPPDRVLTGGDHEVPITSAFAPISAKNPLINDLRRLSRRRSARLDQARFLVEGPTLVGVALAAGARLTHLLRDGG